MDTATFLIGTLEVANLFIAIFIIFFAYLFIRKSHRHSDRLPWEMLIVGIVVFLVSEVLAFVKLINGWEIHGMRNLLQTIFAAFILFAFTHQHHLIHNQEKIQIRKRSKSQSIGKERPKLL